MNRLETRRNKGFEVQFYNADGFANYVIACENELEVAQLLSDFCWGGVKSMLPTVWKNGTKWRPEIKVKENNMATLTESLSKVSIPQLYDNISLAITGKKGSKYDCSKVLVGNDIFEACREYYREQGGDDVGFAMLWCCYGPKAELEGYEVSVEKGWCEL